MFKKFFKCKFCRVSFFCFLALLAGGLNSFVGTGGGILLVFALSVVFGVDKKDAFATSLCITVPISAVGIISYFRAGSVDISLFSTLWLPVLFGGAFGAFLVDKIRLVWLNGIFGLLVIYSGLRLVFW